MDQLKTLFKKPKGTMREIQGRFMHPSEKPSCLITAYFCVFQVIYGIST